MDYVSKDEFNATMKSVFVNQKTTQQGINKVLEGQKDFAVNQGVLLEKVKNLKEDSEAGDKANQDALKKHEKDKHMTPLQKVLLAGAIISLIGGVQWLVNLLSK